MIDMRRLLRKIVDLKASLIAEAEVDEEDIRFVERK